jgi:hypothetical protein
MKKYYLFSVLLIFYSYNILCQRIEIYVGTGLCNSTMTDLKELQNSRLSSLEIPAKITENFPATIQFLGEFKVRFNKLYTGLQYSYSSTGSRISYGDYSGMLNLDIICTSHQIGPTITYSLYNWSRLYFNLYLYTPLINTKVTFKDNIRIYDEESTDKLHVYSTSISIMPGAEINYKISKLSIILRTGYLIDTNPYLHEKNKTDSYLINQKNEKISTDWNGYIIDLVLGVNL